jgi:hypothetical protein
MKEEPTPDPEVADEIVIDPKKMVGAARLKKALAEGTGKLKDRERRPKVNPRDIRTAPENQKSGLPFRVTTEAREPLDFEDGHRPFAGGVRWRCWNGEEYVQARTRRGAIKAAR